MRERELEPLWMTRERGRDSSAPQKEMKVKPWVPGTWFCFSRLLQTSTPSTKLSSPVLERDKVFFSLSLDRRGREVSCNGASSS